LTKRCFPHHCHGTEWNSVSTGFFAQASARGAWAYLNTPPITKARKITTAAKSSPATSFFLSRRRVEQSAC
jgi:hypothetical protein